MTPFEQAMELLREIIHRSKREDDVNSMIEVLDKAQTWVHGFDSGWHSRNGDSPGVIIN